MQTIGDINEQGYLYSLGKQGFNHHKCLLESIANSIDAGAKDIVFMINAEDILMIDNGNGMNKKSIKEMFSMQKSNHANNKSCGVSGIGGKVSLLILSEKQQVNIFTYDGKHDYLKVIIPWDKMFEKGQYTNMIQVYKMTNDEKIFFQKQGLEKGTIIQFPYNDQLAHVIEDNFKLSDERDTLPVFDDMASIVFGRFNVNIFYQHFQNPQNRKNLVKYDYFEGNNSDFYLGKTEAIIRHYQHIDSKENIYIWDNNGDDFIVPKKGKGYAKAASPLVFNLVNYEPIGEMKVITGQRIDKEIFDPEDPLSKDALIKRYRYTEADLHTAYDQTHLKCGISDEKLHESVWEWLCKIPLVRNNQHIGKFSCPDFKASSARGGGDQYHNFFGVRCELHYYPLCYHENKQDEAMHIQQNKNQWLSEDMHINLTRLVKAIRKKKSDEIWKYWNELAMEPIQEQEYSDEDTKVEEKSDQLLENNSEENSDDTEAAPEGASEAAQEKASEAAQEAAATEETMEEQHVESETKASKNIYNKPITVSAYRRGIVSGSELKEKLMDVFNGLDDEENYGDAYVNLYNQLTHF